MSLSFRSSASASLACEMDKDVEESTVMIPFDILRTLNVGAQTQLHLRLSLLSSSSAQLCHPHAYEVELARITGQRYPRNREEENVALEEFFSTPRLIEPGKVIALSGFRAHAHNVLISRLVPELDIQDLYYYVNSVFVCDR